MTVMVKYPAKIRVWVRVVTSSPCPALLEEHVASTPYPHCSATFSTSLDDISPLG